MASKACISVVVVDVERSVSEKRRRRVRNDGVLGSGIGGVLLLGFWDERKSVYWSASLSLVLALQVLQSGSGERVSEK